MAYTIEADEVRQLALLPADYPVDLFMEQANLMVAETIGAPSVAVSDARARLIALNLSAHYAVVSYERGGFTYQESMSAKEGYIDNSGQVKLSSTRFGQQAISFDPTGALAAIDSPKGVAQFRVV